MVSEKHTADMVLPDFSSLVSSSIDLREKLDFPLSTVLQYVSRYEKYGVFREHRTSRSGLL